MFVVFGDRGCARQLSVNNGGQVNRLARFFELMKNAGVVAPECARAYDRDVDRGVASQWMGAAYFAGFFKMEICPAWYASCWTMPCAMKRKL